MLTQNPLIYLLIRRAMRATFPDMGRLTDSLLPTIEVEIIKQFCFYRLLYCLSYYFAIIQLYCLTEYNALQNMLPY